MSKSSSTFQYFFGLGIVILVLGLLIGRPFIFGIGGCGPTNVVQNVTVTDKKIDVEGGGRDKKVESHYMVYTDAGVYEVDNGIMLGMWNADEVYAKLIVGKTYTLTTKGNRVVNFFYQEYPYITNVQLSN